MESPQDIAYHHARQCRTSRHQQDSGRINIHEPCEGCFWTDHFGVTKTQLEAAVHAVGVMTDAPLLSAHRFLRSVAVGVHRKATCSRLGRFENARSRRAKSQTGLPANNLADFCSCFRKAIFARCAPSLADTKSATTHLP